MNRADAYGVLSRELRKWQNCPYPQIVALIDRSLPAIVVRVGEEDVTVRVCMRWANEKKGTIQVEAAADGPSCWNLERLEESIIVSPGQSATERSTAATDPAIRYGGRR